MKNKRRYHAAIGYKAYDQALKPVEEQVNKTAPALLNYKQEDIASRLIQRIVELTLTDFVVTFSSKFEKGSNKLRLVESSPKMVDHPKVSRIFKAKVLLKALMEFYAYWFFMLWCFIRAFFCGGSTQKKFVFLFGVGKENFDSEKKQSEFSKYCRNGPIEPLKTAEKIILQAVDQESFYPEFCFHRFPIAEAINESVISAPSLLRILALHVYVFIIFHVNCIKFPPLALIGRDFSCHSAVEFLNTKGLIKAVVFTNSNYTSQPLWSNCFPKASFESDMVWYSMNVIPLKYADDGAEWPVPSYRHIRVKNHWLWRGYYKDYFDSIGMTGVKNIVDPVLWYLDHGDYSFDDADDTFKIVLFDVTPIDPSYGKELGLVNIYYDHEVMTSFVQGGIAIAKKISEATGKKANLYLKTKREYHKIHDRRYIDFLDALEKSGTVKILSHQTNIYQLVGGSHLTISIPNSSPPLISAQLERPAIYYDPTGSLMANFAPDKNIIFASSPSKLEQVAVGILNKS